MSRASVEFDVRVYSTGSAKPIVRPKPAGNNGLSSLDRTHYAPAIPYTTHVLCNDSIIISFLLVSLAQ